MYYGSTNIVCLFKILKTNEILNNKVIMYRESYIGAMIGYTMYIGVSFRGIVAPGFRTNLGAN